MKSTKFVVTHLAQHSRLSNAQKPHTDEENAKMDDIPYASAAGSIMYSMICSRPDLTHVVSVVSSFMSKSGKEHWLVVEWILRYLRG